MINNQYTRKINKIGLVVMGALVFLVFITGCNDATNLTKVCKKHTEICHELKEDTWCKSERKDVILTTVKIKNSNLDEDKYKLLIAYEDYVKCMGFASQIQHIKLKEKTTLRKNNLYQARANLALLSEETSTSKHPHLLYYQWSRESSDSSLEQLLKLEGTNAAQNSTSQYHLATFYVKRDKRKTLSLLYRSLELHDPGTELHSEILLTLSSIFTKNGQYKLAYIWLRAYQLTLEKPNETIENSLISFQKEKKLDGDFLDNVAENTLAQIEQGTFISPKF